MGKRRAGGLKLIQKRATNTQWSVLTQMSGRGVPVAVAYFRVIT